MVYRASVLRDPGWQRPRMAEKVGREGEFSRRATAPAAPSSWKSALGCCLHFPGLSATVRLTSARMGRCHSTTGLHGKLEIRMKRPSDFHRDFQECKIDKTSLGGQEHILLKIMLRHLQ